MITIMSTAVKMEYPFPPNVLAMQAKEWYQAKELALGMYDTVGARECEKELIECGVNQTKRVHAAYSDWVQVTDVVTEESIHKMWKLINEITNLIRISSTVQELNGEMFGLNVLMSELSRVGEQYE